MPRSTRHRIDPDLGSYHLISHLAGGVAWLTDPEKEHFLRLLERFAAGFFVEIHAFCVMGSHFHILATALEAAAKRASKRELFRRYRAIWGKDADPPQGSVASDGSVEPDPDDGVERLRARLGSISRFMQELKQAFSRWYNLRHERKGYLWGERFKGVIVSKEGDAEIVVAAYIDLNPIRASMVSRPEEYRWCGLGLRARSSHRAKGLLTELRHPELQSHGHPWYRQLVYSAGAVKVPGKSGFIARAVADAVVRRCGALGVLERLRYRCRNLSEGIAIGTAEFVAGVQREANRKFIRPRRFLEPHEEADAREAPPPQEGLFGTRVLRDPPE